MSVDTFIKEIQTRKKNDLAELDKKLSDKKSEIDARKTLKSKNSKRNIPMKQKQRQIEKALE